MATIKLILSERNTQNGQNNITLYVNIPGWKKPFRKTTGVIIDPDRWDPGLQMVKGRGEEVKRMNLILNQKKGLANDIITDYTLMRRDLTEERFRAEFADPYLRDDFLAFFRKKMTENFNRRLIGPATLKSEKRSLRKLGEYAPEGLSFSSLSRTWLEAFDAYHGRKFKNSEKDGTRERERVLKHIRKYLNQARSEMEGVRIPDPFIGFRWPRYKSSPVALTEDELLTLMEYYREPELIYWRMVQIADDRDLNDWNKDQYASWSGVNRLVKVMRGFIFQCLSGVRYSDLKQLSYDNIEDGYLIFTPQKTKDTSGAEVRMLVTELMREFIQQGSGNIFEVYTNQVQNRYLKEVGQVCEFEKVLTSHVGRHTFATLGIKKGIALPILADLMGLASIKTLMMYVHTNQRMRDEAMKKMMFEDKNYPQPSE